MNVNQLRVFLILADTLHFGIAAQQLGVTQPSISRVLSALERHVGVELIDRSSRSIRLTAAGRAFLPSARQAFESADAATRAARTGVDGGLQSLRLGLMIGSAQPQVGQLVKAFCTQHPSANVGLYPVTESNLGQQLADSEVDVAVAWEASIPTGYPHRRLSVAPLVMLLPAKHRLARRRFIRLEDLHDEHIIRPSRQLQPVIDATFTKMTRAKGINPIIAAEVSTTSDLLTLVAAGVGMAAAPLVQGLRYPGVLVKPLRDPIDLSFDLVWVDDRPQAKALLKIVAEHRRREGRQP